MKAGKKIRGITKEANKSLSVLLPLSPPPPSPPPQWRSLLFLVALLAGWWGEAMNKKKARTGTRGEGNPGIDRERHRRNGRKTVGYRQRRSFARSREMEEEKRRGPKREKSLTGLGCCSRSEPRCQVSFVYHSSPAWPLLS